MAIGTVPAVGQGGAPDSTLAAACAGGYSLADGLLLVVFRSDVPLATRRDVATRVGGRLGASAVSGGVAGDYILMPPDRRLDVAADQLIRANGVESVGEVQCPPPPPPPRPATDTAARRDSAARGDTTGVPAPASHDTARQLTAPTTDTTGRASTPDSTSPGGD